MRLILCHRNLDLPKRMQLQDETFVFLCFEDFSVGPLGDWNDPQEFKKQRSAFQQDSSMLKLPDGSKMDYFCWLQTLPKHDVVELVKSGVAIEDIPETYEFEDLAPAATTIEIWHDQSVSGQVFQWYIGAALPTMGVAQDRVSFCLFADPSHEKRTAKFWSDMLLDAPDRSIPAEALSNSDWQQMLKCWEAIANLPAPIDPLLVHHADKHTLNAFDALIGRHPAASSGLTNLQERILRSASVDWKKMAVLVSDAMVAGLDVNDHVWVHTLEDVLNEMSLMTPPLLEKRGGGPMYKCEVRLTSFGGSKQRLIGNED